MKTNAETTVVVGMSGGVDSSVVAAMLQEQGYNVIGVTMKTYDFDDVGGNVANESSCCGMGAINDARLVAAKLGLPHYVVDFRKEFGKEVIDNFVAEYMKGRTPNPCIICNKEIKWGALLKKAESLGADFVATGHYSRIRYDENRKRYVVSQGRYSLKDQSYALWSVRQEALARTMFPLGELTKPEVRALAERFKLRNAEKPESFEICFVADNKYERFLKERIPNLEEQVGQGDLLLNGKPAGKHKGYPFYTIGQRKGIGAFGAKMYVTEIQAATNTIVVGPDEALHHKELIASETNWSGIEEPTEPIRVQAKVRYKDDASDATVYPEQGYLRVVFDLPKRAITPGQSVVFYDGDDLLGGAVIDRLL